MLRKYILYARLKCHPKLAGIEEEKIERLYAEMRRESMVSNALFWLFIPFSASLSPSIPSPCLSMLSPSLISITPLRIWLTFLFLSFFLLLYVTLTLILMMICHFCIKKTGGGVPMTVRYIESIIRMAEAHAK